MADTKTTNFVNDPERLAEGLLTSTYFFDPGGETVTESERVQADFTLRWWRNEFYMWACGFFGRISDSEFRAIVTNHLQVLNNSIGVNVDRIRISANLVNNIILCLQGRDEVRIPEGRDLNSWDDGREKLILTIPVNNGLLMMDRKRLGLDKPVLDKHTPRFFSLYKLPFDYDPEAKCPIWENFLNDVMLGRKDYIDVLQKWTGYLLRPDLREQKFLLCYGEGGNGKGVFFEITQSLIGKESCSQVGISHFSDRFALYSTLGKLVNITNESSHILADEAENVLKSYVAGDTFTFERKFKDPVSAVPTAKLMISTNSLPRFRDKTQAVWRRILLVPFDKVVPPEAQVKNLAEELKKELPGILNWAMEGLHKLNTEGFVMPEGNKELLDTYRKDADPARAFLLDNYSVSPNGEYIEANKLYEHYRTWCNESGCEAMNCRMFGQEIRRVFPNTEHRQKGTGAYKIWVYTRIISNDEAIRHNRHNECPI